MVSCYTDMFYPQVGKSIWNWLLPGLHGSSIVFAVETLPAVCDWRTTILLSLPWVRRRQGSGWTCVASLRTLRRPAWVG